MPDEPAGHVFYGIGEDADGFYVVIRVELKGSPASTFAADARFLDYQDALAYMRWLEDDMRLLAGLLGLDHRRSEPTDEGWPDE